MASETSQGMVRAAKAATKLDVSPRTVKRAIISGQIPGTKLGSLYLVNAAWLDRLTAWPESEAS